jgi:hypothetical protein
MKKPKNQKNPSAKEVLLMEKDKKKKGKNLCLASPAEY